MGQYSITLTDVGEGIAEAELIEWHVKVGDTVSEDQTLAVVMTDKAAVEIPSSMLGRVISLAVNIGDMVAVGAELARLEVQGPGNVEPTQSANSEQQTESQTTHVSAAQVVSEPAANAATASTEISPSAEPDTVAASKPMAAPSVRLRAREADIDLQRVSGSGPGGRILHEDIESYIESSKTPGAAHGREPNTKITQIKVVGLRRKIAEKMALSKSRIPHITIVEEVDIHNLEEFRAELNTRHADTRPKLTLLPFVMKAVVEAAREQPEINAHFDDDAGVINQHGGIHIGIATQTPNGLVVPVVRHCEVNNLWDNASEVNRLAEAAREGQAKREDLGGSTISITSLGPLGAIATTPIINHPEVAIVGINKISVRPHWDGQQFVPRKKINLSCSFDHRVIDGWDAAVMVQKLKSLLESPALLFVED